MRKTTCYIRQNGHVLPLHRKIFPWLMETYPAKGRKAYLQRRDFECRNIREAQRIAVAVYGEGRVRMEYSGASAKADKRSREEKELK